MNFLIEKIKNADILDIIVSIVVIFLIIILCCLIFSNKSFECYYINNINSDNGYTIYRIFAKRNWVPDEKTFQSLDPNLTLKTFNELGNHCIGKN